ncbi:MAG: hypothetical protein IPI51_06845 [Betaproteobacteria bacterium]|nr:hypothetical protein [Betaproteobacteria bacterium]
MKLVALKNLSLFGTTYRKGSTVEVGSQEAAEKLIRSGQARIPLGELASHLAGQRFTTPAGKARGMQVQRR